MDHASEVGRHKEVVEELQDVEVCSCTGVVQCFEGRFVGFGAADEDACRHKFNQFRVDMIRCKLGGCWLLDPSLLLNLQGEFVLLFLLERGRAELQAVEFTTAFYDKLYILVLAYLYKGGYVSATTGSIPVF
jgi:hypothetical protein